jgi:hypothetical protein
MHLNRGLLNWGVFLILLGAIPLAVRQGLLSEEAVSGAWTLWPLLLVAAGIGLLLRRTQLEFAGGLISAATLGIIGGGLLATGGIPFASCGDERSSAAFPTRTGELGPTAAVEVRLNCGDLTIRTADGTAWTVEGVDDDGSGPQIEATPSSLEVHSSDRTGFNFLGSQDRWTVSLPTTSTLDLVVAVNAAEGRLALDRARLGRLEVGANAGEVRVDLGSVAAIASLDLNVNAGDARVELPNLALAATVEANAASVRLCPPSGSGLRVRMNDNITASNNFAERGLVETSDNVWETPGFGSAGVQLEVQAQVNAGSLTVEPAGTCGG